MSLSLRDRARRGARRVARQALAPAVSVIVEARGREADVRQSIDSARDQAGRRLEIVVVVAEERLRVLADEAAAGDWRVRVVEAPGADPAAARRTGAEAARGDLLLFLPPRQQLMPWGTAVVDNAHADVVVGEDHALDADRASPVLARLLVRREIWHDLDDDGEPCGQTAALQLHRGPHEDGHFVGWDRGALRPKPFEPQTNPLAGLAARIAFDASMLDLAEGLDKLDRRGCAAAILARDLPPFLDAVERCDDAQWERLHAHAAGLVREAGAALADVPVEDRVLAWLVSEGRRDDAVAYVAARRFTRGQFPTDVRDGLIRAELEVSDVPDHVLAVTEAESPLHVHEVAMSPSDAVLWVGITRLDEESPEVTVSLDGLPLETVLSRDPAVTRWMGDVHQCHDGGVVTVRWGGSDGGILDVELRDRGVRRSRWTSAGPDDGPGLEKGRRHPDLTDEEAGPYRQHQLQLAYASVTEPVDPRLVYFQAFLGQAPTDHPGAIQAALQRVRPAGVRVLWGVADSSVRVPDGAEPVQLRSREWYDAMARAAWIVTNVELEPWFRRRDGQEVLETYHGYPSKAMGLSQWRARDLTSTHLDEMLRRTSGTWNNLLTPIPAMDRYYRENYAFDGRIISQGYPRDDMLVAPGHEQRRTDTRARLGIAPDQAVILYAPTWRDDLATNFRSAQALLHLDVAEVARELGPGHVILLRGHRFHAPTEGGAQVLDVTAYPEVNDLILAADAAVLDYSSLRFDIALTGKPMVFLVPDLRDYTERTRGFLYPFEDSAPGPFVETTAEVLDALRDLPALRTRWRDRIAAFNATYQPNADGHAADRVVAEFFAPLLEGH